MFQNSGSVPSPQTLSLIAKRPACSYNNGQHDSSVSYRFRRRHQICLVSASDPTTHMGVPTFLELQGHPCYLYAEQGCRLVLSAETMLKGVETPPIYGGHDLCQVEQGDSGPLCLKSNNPLPPLVHLDGEDLGQDALAHIWQFL